MKKQISKQAKKASKLAKAENLKKKQVQIIIKTTRVSSKKVQS